MSVVFNESSNSQKASSQIDCSVVIPVLNESASIQQCFTDVEQLVNASENSIEVIFVDGGSQDDTCQQIAASGFQLVVSSKGRARQMNAGAQSCRGQIVVFLHADTRVYPGLVDDILKACQQGAMWGRFNVRIDGGHWMFNVIATMINWRSKLTKVATGDQVIWVEKETFDAVDGYREMPLMEDVELSKRLRSHYKMFAHSRTVITSGRRWLKFGIWKTIFLMWSLRFDYWRGIDVERLARRYR